MTPVAVALGSNLGPREQTLNGAIRELEACLAHLRRSAFVETEPVGVSGTQPPYLNAAVVGESALPPAELLAELLAIERRFGRERPYERAPRTLDLDLILYGDRIVDEPGLIVPHPRFRERAFVLRPLAEIAPEWVDPVSGLSIAQLLARLRR